MPGLSARRAELRADGGAHDAVASRAVLVLCGCAWLGVAWSFSYLDRSFGDFPVAAMLWALWGAIGFGTGVMRHGRPMSSARDKALLTLTVIAGVIAVFPGFLMYILLRWAAFSLLMVTAARASGMRTRRDFYFCLACLVTVSLMVVTHGRSDWSIWFYLGPAWLCMALALAWDHAAAVPLAAWRKTTATLAFLAACMAVALTIAALVPRPNILGFGFLPPGTDTPGRFQRGPGAPDGNTGATGSNTGKGGAGPATTASAPSLLDEAIDALRRTLRDPHVPGWQKGVVEGMLGLAETARLFQHDIRGRIALQPGDADAQAYAVRIDRVLDLLRLLLQLALWLLLLALAAWLAWRARLRLGIAAACWGARALAPWQPALSMQCSTRAVRWTLARSGHTLRDGLSLTELVREARMPEPAQGWMARIVGHYGEFRFGNIPAAASTAGWMAQAARASAELCLMPNKTTKQR